MPSSPSAAPTRRDVLAASAAAMATAIAAPVQAQAQQAFALPRRPEDVPGYFVQTFNARDLDAVMRMYAADAVFVPKPGTVLKGLGAIRAATAEFMALNLPIKSQVRHVLVNADTALLISDWVIEGNGPQGKPMKLNGAAADVAQRQPDGTWMVIIDNPFGTA